MGTASLWIGIAICWQAGSPPADEAMASPEVLAKYREMAARTPKTAASELKLATWCEQNHLKAEAYAHYSAVTRLDPTRETAWRKLGYKKHEGRWMTDAQIADQAEFRKDEKVWGPQLKKWHKAIHRGKGQDEAKAALAAIVEPSAIAPAYREFAGGGELDRTLLVQILGQIETPLSSKILATLALRTTAPATRRAAVETLRRRPPEDFLDVLVAQMHDPLTYRVRPVGGPGNPGILVVEDETYDVQRYYNPPSAPAYVPEPGDYITYDADGLPVVNRAVRKFDSAPKGVTGSKTLVSVDRMADVQSYQIGQADRVAQ